MKPNIPNGKHYAFLDLPQLPLDLEQACLDQANNKEAWLFELGREANSNIRDMTYNGTVVSKQQCIFEVYDAPLIVKQWLLDNKIINTLTNIEVGVMRSYGGNVLFPHQDRTYDSNDGIVRIRKYALNYLLTEPGPRTCFYNIPDINNIIEGVVVPKSYWHILEVKQYHGVENIEWERISLSITMEK